MMYVPGNDWKKINKISSMGADSFILDCEDGVALNRKVIYYCSKHEMFLCCSLLFYFHRMKLEVTFKRYFKRKCFQY